MALTTVNPAMIGQTSTGAASLTATGSAAASLITAAGTALSANSSGYITQPFQPLSVAIISTSLYSLPNGTVKLPYDSTIINTGSCFNTSLNRFTAPVTGTYFLNITYTITGTGSTLSYAGAILYKNGGSLLQTYNSHTSGQYAQPQMTYIVALNAGDYIEAYSDAPGGGASIEGGRSFFSVCLLG